MNNAENMARRFHDTYERLAPWHGYETRKETKQFDPRTPNGKLMIAVCGEIAAALTAERDKEKAAFVDLWAEREVLREHVARLRHERDSLRQELEKIRGEG